MLEVILTPQTFWVALKDIGGMLSLMFFFAIFAACRHTNQFNESLKKSFNRAFEAHKQDPTKNMAMMSVASVDDARSIEMVSIEKKKKMEKRFIDYFSFGKYMELH